MKEDLNQEMLKRLDAIVFLLLEIKDKEGKMSVKNKVKLLSEVGFGYSQIAKVLGKNPGNIAVQLNIIKKEEESKSKQLSKNVDTGVISTEEKKIGGENQNGE